LAQASDLASNYPPITLYAYGAESAFKIAAFALRHPVFLPAAHFIRAGRGFLSQ
jgi:hypothetical protein